MRATMRGCINSPPLATAAIAITVWSGVAMMDWPIGIRLIVLPSQLRGCAILPRDSSGSGMPVNPTKPKLVTVF